MSDKEQNFYQQLRRKIQEWESSDQGKNHKYLEYILAVPDFFYVIWKLTFDDRIPEKIKLRLAGLIAYWLLPIDLIPETIVGPIGFLDDLALTAALLNKIMIEHGDVVEEYWSEVSDEDILATIEMIISNTDDIIGAGMWTRVQKIFNEKFGS